MVHTNSSGKVKGCHFGGRMNEQNVIYMMKYNSALTRKEILTCATAWMNREDAMLSETSHSQKDEYCTVPLI